MDVFTPDRRVVEPSEQSAYDALDKRARRARAAADALIAPLLPPGHPPGLKAAHVLDEMRAQLASLPSEDREIMRLKIALVVKELLDVTDIMVKKREEISERLHAFKVTSRAAKAYVRNSATIGGAGRRGRG